MPNPSQRPWRFKRLGRYRLLEELGRDGDGVIYKARDPLLDRLVAIKAVEWSAAASVSSTDFERKARLAGGLTHPNIVVVHDTGIHRDVAYIATELAGGETLRGLLDSGVILAPGAIERIVAQVADGLEFTHQHAIVHGDVSPSNIVVLDIGFVKISCLGNALFPAGSKMPEGSICASSRYVSPEHAMNAPLDARSDIFSLGIVLYEMLTGIAPFTGSTRDELIGSIVNEHPRPPSSVNRTIPSGFDYIVARALSKEPDHRYQSARDIAFDLRKWALEEPRSFVVPRWPRAEPRGTSQPRERAAAGDAMGGTSPEEPREDPERLRARRQLLLYGLSGAVLTLSVAWTATSRRVPTPEPEPAGPAAATPEPPRPPAAQWVHVRSEPLPSRDDPEEEPPDGSTAESAPRRVAAQPMARLKLAVSPWGEVYVDGRRRGVSPPLRQVELAPGKHSIEIRNTVFSPRRQLLDVKANARLKIKHRFQ